MVWIDTAFNGGLAIPQKKVAELGLSKQSSAEAILVDGRSIELETFACFLDWFGNTYEPQIAANDGEHPLLGTMLLDGRRMDINYAVKTVELVTAHGPGVTCVLQGAEVRAIAGSRASL